MFWGTQKSKRTIKHMKILYYNMIGFDCFSSLAGSQDQLVMNMSLTYLPTCHFFVLLFTSIRTICDCSGNIKTLPTIFKKKKVIDLNLVIIYFNPTGLTCFKILMIKMPIRWWFMHDINTSLGEQKWCLFRVVGTGEQHQFSKLGICKGKTHQVSTDIKIIIKFSIFF